MKHIIKHLLFALFLISVSVCASAQTVRYSYKIFSPEGCIMEYGIIKQESQYYIFSTVHSDRMQFLNESTMKIRTFNDEVITLQGEVISSGSKTAGVVCGYAVVPETELISTAQFAITPEELEMLNHGVAKVRLTMIPMDHERTFAKDKIGKKLYQFYLKAKAKDDDF